MDGKKEVKKIIVNKESAAGEEAASIKQFINTSLVDLVVDKIRANIYSGKYLPGQKLIVREISEELGVSHTPVKDALNRLIAEGYIEALPRKSMVVKEYTNNDFIDNLGFRLSMEIFCAGEIVDLAREDGGALIADLKTIYKAMDALVKESDRIEYETWVELETKFHRRYMRQCDNQRMISLYDGLDSNKQSYFAYLRNQHAPLNLEHFERNLTEHWEIIEAVGALDRGRFIRATAAHVLRACSEYAVDESSMLKIARLKKSTEPFCVLA